jgi:phage repressor protein C with HTH and peptisase S24 domain
MIAYLQEQSCDLSLVSDFAYLPGMDGLEADRDLITRLVEWSGHKPARIATAAGMANTTLNRPYKGTATTRISQPTLDKLKRAYPDFPGWNDAPEPNARLAPPMEGASERRMHRDVPIFGTALGAEAVIDGEAVEQTELNRGEVIGYRRRPVLLDGRVDIYALYVQGSSMEPRHRDGAVLFVEERRRPSVGDDAVIYLRPLDDTDDGKRAHMVMVKTIVRKSASYIELEQYSPRITFRVPMDRVVRMDRVITLDELTD